jgi:hypothetical protein
MPQSIDTWVFEDDSRGFTGFRQRAQIPAQRVSLKRCSFELHLPFLERFLASLKTCTPVFRFSENKSCESWALSQMQRIFRHELAAIPPFIIRTATHDVVELNQHQTNIINYKQHTYCKNFATRSRILKITNEYFIYLIACSKLTAPPACQTATGRCPCPRAGSHSASPWKRTGGPGECLSNGYAVAAFRGGDRQRMQFESAPGE